MKLFNTGDVVILNSGGPAMTVRKQAQGLVDCEWFIDAELKTWDFKEEQIQLAFPERKEELPQGTEE